ncbi:MAG TPA: hypothetical protein VK808_00675 [Bacteroidia bacterium]|jgi:hypothetical protein|nr:hypothetical protein [Bacteroidia bacterium]
MKKIFLLVFSITSFSYYSFSQADSTVPEQMDSSSTFHFLKYLSVRGGFGVGIGSYKDLYAIPNDGGSLNISAGIMYNSIGLTVSAGYNYSNFRINTNEYYAGGAGLSLNTTNFHTYYIMAGFWIPVKIYKRVSMDLKILGGLAYSCLPGITTEASNYIYTDDFKTNSFIETPYIIRQTINVQTIVKSVIGFDFALRYSINKHIYAELPYFHFMVTPLTSFTTQMYSTVYSSNVPGPTEITNESFSFEAKFINIGVGVAYRFQGNYGIAHQNF